MIYTALYSRCHNIFAKPGFMKRRGISPAVSIIRHYLTALIYAI